MKMQKDNNSKNTKNHCSSLEAEIDVTFQKPPSQKNCCKQARNQKSKEMDNRPNNLTREEYKELRYLSAIDPELIARNFFHLEGLQPCEYLFISDKLPRYNSGRIKNKILKQYEHLEAGGIWIAGLDPQNNWLQMEWGRFKPKSPRIDWKRESSIKYESPPKTSNRVTYFSLSDHNWDRVAQRHDIKRYDSPLALRLQDKSKQNCFWEWVQDHPEIPIILTEGEKKAACLLSLGFVAIALPGIWNGRIGQKGTTEKLHPDLMPMAQPGRKFIILFDYETKKKSRWSVYQATVRTAKVIQATGCICEVAVLPGPEKGVDDFVVSRGKVAAELLTDILNDALTSTDYAQRCRPFERGLSKYKPDVNVNVKYLNQVVKLPDSGLVVLASDMGTGKTQLMRDWLDKHPDCRFLNNGHRVSLLKNLASRLNTEIYSSLSHKDWAKAQTLSITVDSLYKLNTNLLTYGCVFIDEACQYLTHLLHSKTCVSHRAEILEVLEYIVFQAPLVVLADAHMDDITIDFFRAMRPENEVPFLIKNEWKNGGRDVHWYESKEPSALVTQIAAALLADRKVMVVSDSKRFIKKLEMMLTMPIELKDSDTTNDKDSKRKLRIWSIHSENSGSDENIAFIEDITNAVKDVDALLASPTLGTGIDIPDYHFDMIFGVFHAVSQTATECAQMLYRYRPNVPMNIWVAPHPPNSYANCNPKKIKKYLLETNEMTAFLIRIDRKTGRRGAEKEWALDTYCQIQAKRNQSINNLRADLHSLLEEMGNKIISMGAYKNEETRDKLQEAAKVMDITYMQAVTKAKMITASEYRRRQSQSYLNPEEVVECEKFRIAQTYGMPVTEQLVARDEGGKLIRLIANLEAILAPPNGIITDQETGKKYPAPPEVVADRDLMEREILSLSMDWGNYSASWFARYILGLHDILSNPNREFRATDPDLIAMNKLAHEFAPSIKVILGFKVPSFNKPVWLLSQFLEQLGLKLTSRKEGGRGKQIRVHSLAPAEKEFALSVIAYRQSLRAKEKQQEEEPYFSKTQHPVTMNIMSGVGSHNEFVVLPPKNDLYKKLEEDKDTQENQKKESDQHAKIPSKLTKEEAKIERKRVKVKKALREMIEQGF